MHLSSWIPHGNCGQLKRQHSEAAHLRAKRVHARAAQLLPCCFVSSDEERCRNGLINATSSSRVHEEPAAPSGSNGGMTSDAFTSPNVSQKTDDQVKERARGTSIKRRTSNRWKRKRKRQRAEAYGICFDPTDLHPKDFQPLYLKIRDKFMRDPQSLTAEEMKFFANGMPSKYRLSMSHEQIVDMFDSNALGIAILRRCYLKDLNNSVRLLCCEGHVNKAAKLVDHLVQTYKFNQHTFAMFFDGCAIRRDLSMALTHWIIWAKAGLLDEMGPASSCALLKCVIKSDVERAADVMVVLHDWNAPMNSKCYNSLIHAFSTHGYISDALDIFGLMQVAVNPELKPDVFTYTHLINGVMRTQQWDLVKGIYSNMEKQGVVPDAPLAAAFMKGFTAANDIPAAQLVFDSLPAWGLEPNVYHFNSLLIAHAHQGDHSQCQRLLGEMLEKGLEPDAYTVLALLTALSRCSNCLPEMVTDVLQLMQQFHIQRNTFISTGIINAFRNCRTLSADDRKAHSLEVFYGMKTTGIEITAETANSVICVLSECGDVHAAFRMLDEMARLGVEPTAHTYTLLSMIATDHGFIEKAEEFAELKRTMTLLVGSPQTNSRSGRPMW